MTTTLWLSPAEDRAWRGYRRMKRLLDAELERDLVANCGLSDSDYEVLTNLTEAEGHQWRANELASRLRWSSSRLSHHIKRMEGRGLVTRAECVDDGRGAVLSLSPQGLLAIEQAAPAHVADVRRRFIDILSPAQLQALEEIAKAVVDHLTEDTNTIG